MKDKRDTSRDGREATPLATNRSAKTRTRAGAATARAAGGSAGGRPRRDEVTALQLRGIAAILSHPTISAAADEIGVHPRTMTRWFAERAFSAEYERQMAELQLELWRRMLSVRGEVWERFLELLASADERIAIRATTWLLDRMLAVPAILTRSTGPPDESTRAVSPRLRAFLDETPAIDTDEDYPA